MTTVPADADRDFTASAFIVDDGQVLLLKHTKLDAWIQPGGHIEPGEVPHQTAVREVQEETGYTVELVSDTAPRDYTDTAFDLPRPLNVNLHKIRDGHWHCDFAYLATVTDTADPTHADEHDGRRWFTLAELRDDTYDIPENIRKTARTAVQVFNGDH